METELGSLRLVAAGPERDLYRDLLLLADESPEQVASYMNEGDLFVVEDKAGTADGLVLVLYDGDREAELKSVAVRPEQQGQGVAKRMLASVLARLRERGVRRVLVASTASESSSGRSTTPSCPATGFGSRSPAPISRGSPAA